MDENGAVAARDALIANDDIVVGEPADAVEPHVQRKHVAAILEIESEPPGFKWQWGRREGLLGFDG
jgi:hypothetical protein